MLGKSPIKWRQHPDWDIKHQFKQSLTNVSGVGSSPALATCKTSQVLLAGVPGGCSWGSPVFAPPTDWHMS